MKFSVRDFFSKCDKIRNFLRIWSHLMKKSLMENFIFRAVIIGISLVNVNKSSSTESPNRLWKVYRNIQESTCQFISVANPKTQIYWPDKILLFADFTQRPLIDTVSESNFLNTTVKL